jgi:perosamine synthetase
MKGYIAHTRPFYDHQEATALLETIGTRLVNEGDLTRNLVDCTARLTNCVGGVATSTGTLGLHLALSALGVATQKDKVIIPDFACRSLYDCVRIAGGTPVHCDINLEDFSLSIDAVRASLCEGTRAIILPHMYGCPADIDAFLALNVPIIEDCAHSLGAEYGGSPVGSFGALSCISFEGSKLVAAGEGGVVTANTQEMVNKLNVLRYGLDGHFAYHYRLSNLTAAVALVQIDKLPFMINRRRHIAEVYHRELLELENQGLLTLPKPPPERLSVYYRFVVICNTPSTDLIAFANQRGVLIRNPLTSGCLSDSFTDCFIDNPNSRLLVANGASLPIYPDLTDDDLDRVVDVVRAFYR